MKNMDKYKFVISHEKKEKYIPPIKNEKALRMKRALDKHEEMKLRRELKDD